MSHKAYRSALAALVEDQPLFNCCGDEGLHTCHSADLPVICGRWTLFVEERKMFEGELHVSKYVCLHSKILYLP